MRLNKFIASSGRCSRRKADDLIESGKVKVNGKSVTTMGVKIDPSHDQVSVNGTTITIPTEKTLLLLNKPTGYTTTKSDPHAEKTVYDLLPKKFHHLHPVGRLDRDSEGLLLLTNDGNLTQTLTHPSQEHNKKYQVKLRAPAPPPAIKKLESGIDIPEEVGGESSVYHTAPCQIRAIDNDGKRWEVTLSEGRNRQIRKMFQKIGCPVVYLKRLEMGPYTLGNLSLGQWKEVPIKQPH